MVEVWSLQPYADQKQPIASGASEHSCSSVACTWLPSSGSFNNAQDAKRNLAVCCKLHLVVTHTEVKTSPAIMVIEIHIRFIIVY